MSDDAIVMNCISALRETMGRNLGRRVLTDMMESEKNVVGFATTALEDHWSPRFKRWQMEKLGFEPVDSIDVVHKTKHRGERCMHTKAKN